MTYAETINYLYNSTPVFQNVGKGAYKEGLENTKALDKHFGHPHKNFKTIHIAGTNGKGSCSHTLAAILQEAGYKVGLYTSPHLVDFRERIRVNGQTISQQYVIDFVENERSFFEPLHPSFFELTTALAFKYFAEEKVDVAVIEVGLGGRLDCTNIITPLLSIITNISFDHTQFLGNTLAAIASEKAGIIKPGVPVVIGETVPETRPVFEEKAQNTGAPIIFAEDTQEIIRSTPDLTTGGRTYATRHHGTISGALGGLCQEKNANTILHAAALLPSVGLKIQAEDISKGFENVCQTTGLMGRWQKIKDEPLTICDTGHNGGGFAYISQQLKAQKCRTMRIVFGMVDDKDIDNVLNMLPKDAVYYLTQAHVKRALDVKMLQEKAAKAGLTNTRNFNDVTTAYETACKEAAPDDFIYVGGSSYVVADFFSKNQ